MPKSPKSAILCINCGKPIPKDRIEALKFLNVPPSKYTHTNCSTTTRIKGLYAGEVGTSEIIFVDKIYNDNVRSIFRKAETEDEPDDREEDNEETED